MSEVYGRRVRLRCALDAQGVLAYIINVRLENMTLKSISTCLVLMIASLSAKEPYEALLSLSAACQNAANAKNRGQWEREKFEPYIKATDKAMAELVDSGYLVQEYILFQSPAEMSFDEGKQFGMLKRVFAKKHEAKYGIHALIEMMGWEYRESLKGGRMHHEKLGDSDRVQLRVRLPKELMKEYKEVFGKYIVKPISQEDEQGAAE